MDDTGIARRIAHYADHSTLLRLRHLSSTWRDAADAALFSHVLLLDIDGVEVCHSTGRALPGIPASSPQATPADHARWLERLSLARCVDYHDAIVLSRAEPELERALYGAETVRRKCRAGVVECTQLIDTVILGSEEEYLDDVPPRAAIGFVPASVQHHTLTIRYDPRHARLADSRYDLGTHKHALDLTVVLVQDEDSRRPQPAEKDTPRWGFLRPLLRELAFLSRPPTVVGLDAVPRHLLGLPSDADVADEFMAEVTETFSTVYGEDEDAPEVTLLSHTAFRTLVGSEWYTLATEVPGPKACCDLDDSLTSDEDSDFSFDTPIDQSVASSFNPSCAGWEEFAKSHMKDEHTVDIDRVVRVAARALLKGCAVY